MMLAKVTLHTWRTRGELEAGAVAVKPAGIVAVDCISHNAYTASIPE